MPIMNFDLEDGLPPVSFSINGEGAERMMNFMSECQQDRDARAMLVAELEQLRAEKAAQPSAEDYSEMLRAFFCEHSAGGYNDGDALVPIERCKSKLAWIVDDQRAHAAASAKPVEQEPVAWGILSDTCPELTNDPVLANYWERKGRKVTPLYAAPQAPQAAPSWQPIESAPKDGKPVLLYTAEGQIEGRWLQGYWEQSPCYATQGYSDAVAFPLPSHWMPLPAAPEIAP